MLASAGLDSLPDCWCIVPPDVSSSRGTEVLLAKGETIWRLDEIDCVDQVRGILDLRHAHLTSAPLLIRVEAVITQRLSRGPYLSITPSPSGRFLALLCTSSSSSSAPQLWVTSADFSRSFSDVALTSEMSEGERGRPRLLEWCGGNSVVVAWERTVVMIGPYGETLKYVGSLSLPHASRKHPDLHANAAGSCRFFYTDPVHLVSEIDGTRIFSSEGCDFLQLVPRRSSSPRCACRPC